MYRPDDYRKSAVLAALSSLGDLRAFLLASKMTNEFGEWTGRYVGKFVREHFNLKSKLVSFESLRAFIKMADPDALQLLSYRLARYPDHNYNSILEELKQNPKNQKAIAEGIRAFDLNLNWGKDGYKEAFSPSVPAAQKAIDQLRASPKITTEDISELIKREPTVAARFQVKFVDLLLRLSGSDVDLFLSQLANNPEVTIQVPAIQAIGLRPGSFGENKLIEKLKSEKSKISTRIT